MGTHPSLGPESGTRPSSAPSSADGRPAQIEAVAFVGTMPDRYRALFDWAAAREHSLIALARGSKPVYVDLFDSGNPHGPGLCVVAPDAPGLLAAISAGLMKEGFDISRAEVFTRGLPDGSYEAVDFFWVRRDGADGYAALPERAVAAVRSTLAEILSAGASPCPAQRSPAKPTSGTANTSVRFLEHQSGAWLTLELESDDRPGLLLAVTSALFAEHVQIVGSRIRTRGTRAHDRFELVDTDGSPIAGTRLQRIQFAVLSALDAAGVPSLEQRRSEVVR